MKQYLLALDEGTTSTRAILFDQKLNPISVAQHEFAQIYPQPGWVEHDPLVIYANQYASMTECVAQSGIDPSEIAGIGITNQRETTIVWNRKTGKPIYNAIVWQCRRTQEICLDLEKQGLGERISEITGLRIDPYFSGTKIKWILDHVEGAQALAEQGDLLFGTIDTWLIWKLTNGKVHITDRTNASRTMLYDLQKQDWSDELLKILNIPRSMLPKIVSSSEEYCTIDLMGAQIPISGIAGDQQAALFGQGCFQVGDVKTTYGTGCFLLAQTGTTPIRSNNGLLTTVAATEKGAPIEYALEGSVFIGGAVIQWLRDELGLIYESRDCEYFAKKVKDSAGVYLVPAFSGLGAPYWDADALGTMVGLSRGTNRYHIIRAALESIAYQTEDVIASMGEDMGKKPTRMKVDGGAAANQLLMQFQADLSHIQIIRNTSNEATARGAAALAGLAMGLFKSRTEISQLIEIESEFTPTLGEEQRQSLLDGWHQAIHACKEYKR